MQGKNRPGKAEVTESMAIADVLTVARGGGSDREYGVRKGLE